MFKKPKPRNPQFIRKATKKIPPKRGQKSYKRSDFKVKKLAHLVDE